MPFSTVTVTCASPPGLVSPGGEAHFDLAIPDHMYLAAQWYVGTFSSPSDTSISIEPLQGFATAFGSFNLSGTDIVSGHNVYTEIDTGDTTVAWLNLNKNTTQRWWLASSNSFTVDFIQVVLSIAPTNYISTGMRCAVATNNSILAVSWTDDYNRSALAIHPSPLSNVGSGVTGWRPTCYALGHNPGQAEINSLTTYAGANGAPVASPITFEHLADSNHTTIKATELFQSCRDSTRVFFGYEGSLWWNGYISDINAIEPGGPLQYSMSGTTLTANGVDLTFPSYSVQVTPPHTAAPIYSGHNNSNGWWFSRQDLFVTGLFPSDGGLLSDFYLATEMNTEQGIQYDSTPWGSGIFSTAAQMETLPSPSIYFGSIQFNSIAGLLFSRRDGSVYWKHRDVVGNNDTFLDSTLSNRQDPGQATSGEGLVIGITYLTSHSLVALIWDWLGVSGTKTIKPMISNDGGSSWAVQSTISVIGAVEVPPYLTSIDNVPIIVLIDTTTRQPKFYASEDGGLTWS